MIRLAAALVLLYLSVGAGMTARTAYEAVTSRSGFAAHYRPGLFERVSRNRGLPVVDCMVAVTSDHRIGAWVIVTRTKTGRSEKCRITDVCRKQDCANLRRRGIVAELSFDAARRLCGITHYASEPPKACPVRVQW